MTSPEAEKDASQPQVAPIVFLVFVIFAWGGNYTWVKLALQDGGAWTFNALRYSCAVLFLAVVLLGNGGYRKVLPEPGERLQMSVIGILQIALMTGGTTLALELIEANRTVLIAYSMPVWAMVLSFLILGERVDRRMLAGLALGLAGLGLLCAPWAMDWANREAVIGSTIALGATLAWALGSVLYRARKWRSGFWQQVFGQLAAGACVVVAAGLLFERQGTTPTPTYVTIVIYNAIVPSILGFWCWARALDRIPVATASQVLLLSPVFGVVLSAVVLGEVITGTLVASATLIVTGALLSYWRSDRRAIGARPAIPRG